jgi:hypothetical protein
MAGAVPELAAGAPGSAHHLWVGRVAFGWLLWVAWQTGLLYDDNDTAVSAAAQHGVSHVVCWLVSVADGPVCYMKGSGGRPAVAHVGACARARLRP